MELTLLPEGHFRLIEGDGADLLLTDAAAARIRKAFAASTAEGFLCLAAYDGTLISSLAFGRAFARYYLTALCQSPRDGENAFPAVTPPDEAAWDDWIERAPPLRGLELLDAARANALWQELDAAARAAAESTPGGLDGFLQSIDPVWRTVGRVTFHLAENKKHPERPFAFMATYASRLSEIGRVQHLPLGRALTEYAGARNRKALLHLLAPIQQAVGTSELVRELFESGRLYQPAAWTTQQAYRLLRDLPAIEAAGVIVRVPDWWNARRPPRPRVTVKVGDGKPAQLGAAALLDFNLSVTLGDAELSPEEIQALLNSGCGLVSLRGQWVEVDAGQLKDVLDHWKAVERRAAREGIPFAEAMRLLAGLSAEGPGGDADAAGTERIQAWTGIRAGRWLDETLARLRQPETVGGTLPCADELQATPRPYQETGIRWLHFMASLGLGACLADDMGLGKTLQTLGLLLWLRREGTAHAPSLLVAPASLLANWKDEARRFAPSLRLLVVHPAGDDQERLQACADDPEAGLAEVDLAVTSYGMVARTPWLAQVPWRLVVLDEAQAIKNAATRQARAVKALQSRTRLALAGTPVENRAGDLWSLFDFINPGLLGDARRFGAYIRNRGDQPGAYAPLRRLTRPYILRRLKTDRRVIDDLPEKTVMPAYCGLTPAQAALYADHVRQLREALEKKGQKLSPVVLKGFAIASTFWGKAWCKNIESYHDYSNRLPRGRSYVRSNSVIDLHIERGVVLAQVIGSALYIVEIEIRPVAAERWQAICKECAGKIGSMIELLQGRLSTEVMSVMTSQETGLFPRPAEIRFTCSCPDSAGMCKHIAAVMYGIGNRLDTQPELLFLLRGVDSADLLANIAAAPDTGTFPDAEALVAEELSDVFGVEIDTSVPTVPPAIAPESEIAPKRPRGRPRKSTPAAAPAPAAAPEPETAPKRPRGRPRKSTSAAASEPAAAPKRPRGRPRKSEDAATPEPAAAPKRPRGRPRKDTSATAPQPAAPKRSRKSTTAAAQESETAPKRPRGRPRKDASTAAAPEPAAAPKRPRGRPRKDAPAAT